jgi:hypothetical protein
MNIFSRELLTVGLSAENQIIPQRDNERIEVSHLNLFVLKMGIKILLKYEELFIIEMRLIRSI